MICTIFFRPRLKPNDLCVRHQRVMPSDIDINMHMTNSRYASFADLARIEYMMRTGMMKVAMEHGWRPILLATKIRYRREIKTFRAFRVTTRLRWWNETHAIFEVQFLTRARDGSDILAAISLERGGFYARNEKRFIGVSEMLTALGLPQADPPPATPEILAFVNAEDALRNAT